jgi:hypothetical protein
LPSCAGRVDGPRDRTNEGGGAPFRRGSSTAPRRRRLVDGEPAASQQGERLLDGIVGLRRTWQSDTQGRDRVLAPVERLSLGPALSCTGGPAERAG